MEKILLAMDSRNVDQNAVSLACYISRLTHSKLTGVFLDQFLVEEEIVISQLEGEPVIGSITFSETSENDDEVTIKEEYINLFKGITERKGVQAFVYIIKGTGANEIISESRFTDVLIVDAATSVSMFQEGTPSSFVKQILQGAECPVIISPEHFNGIDNIVFCYDGSKSSVFAIKQFTYLFPELKNRRAKVIYLNSEDEFLEEDQQALTDWLKYHYSDVEFILMQGNATEAFFNYLLKKKNDFVVMGAYGRGLLASFFSDGVNSNEARTTSLPIFVAHY